MCDFYSWGVVRKDMPEKGLTKGQLLGLTDDMILAKWGQDIDFKDKDGHSAIAEYYGIQQDDIEHHESCTHVPKQFVADLNAGRMRQMLKASDRRDVVSVRYHPSGWIDEDTVEADGYTIDGSSPEAKKLVRDYLEHGDHRYPEAAKIVLEAWDSGADPFGNRSRRSLEGICDAIVRWNEYPEQEDNLNRLHNCMGDLANSIRAFPAGEPRRFKRTYAKARFAR